MVEARVYLVISFSIFIALAMISALAIGTQYLFYSTPVPIPQPYGTGEDTSKYVPLGERLGLYQFAFIVPAINLVLSIVLWYSCIKPLESGLLPSKGLVAILALLGYVFGAIITGILLTIVYMKLFRETARP